MKRKPETTICAIESLDRPMCPNCRADVPVPGIRNLSYECPECKKHYTLNYETVRLYKTQIWLTGSEA